MKPIEAAIRAKLTATFAPVHLEVTNESDMHSVPPDSETHFKVVLAAPAFAGKRQVQRHQAIYAALEDDLRNGVHALALHAYSADEWQANQAAPDAPRCLGGGKRS